ncbi:MAG: prohibitin family protein [Thermodesulfobacteriota bacterium]|nr:prohibitin family protein [Thermodesulfobacteriota bacterium]
MRKLYNKIKYKLRYNLPFVIVTLLIISFLVAYLFDSIFITIKSGEGGVLYSRFMGGTVTDEVYPEGFHIIAPWDVMNIYNVRVQQTKHEMDVLTNKGLPIHLTLSLRYQPDYDVLGVLHQKVGPDYVTKIVIPEVEATLRSIVGRYQAEEVYSTKRGVVQKFVNEAIHQVSERFVRIDDVLITNVALPQMIREAIEHKLEQKQRAEAYVYILQKEEKEAERKRIEATGLRDYNMTVASSLSDEILTWKGVQATLKLSESENAKVVVVGSGKDGLPIILNTEK